MLTLILIVALFTLLGALVGASYAISQNYWHNRTKKVCDVCFREIKRVNELVKDK